MTAGRLPWTGPLHWSHFKLIGQSPAHFRYACDVPLVATAAMRLGTLVHYRLLGGPRTPILFLGAARRGGAWDVFERAHRGKEVYTATEWEQSEPIAEAVRAHPMYPEWIGGGETEVSLEWSMGGFEFATRGIDVLRTQNACLTDFKTTRSADPYKFRCQADELHYFEQLASYDEGARQNGFEASKWGIFGAETKAPYPCTVLEIERARLEEARKTVLGWLELLRRCVETDTWPEYTSSPVPVGASGGIPLQGLDELEEAS